MYAYGADSDDGRGMRGVTDAFDVAERRLIAALRAMPHGAWGTIRLAYFDSAMRPYPSYRYGPIVARAWRDAGLDAVLGEENMPRRRRVT